MNQSISQNSSRIESCDCGKPIVKRLDSSKFQFLRRQGGESDKIVLQHNGDRSEVVCDKCLKKITFSTGKVQLGMGYVIAKPKE
jgi:hypothetical protein